MSLDSPDNRSLGTDIHTETYTSYNGTNESRNVTFYECTTCLTDSTGSPGITTSSSGSALFRNLPPSESLWAANALLHTGTFERIYAFYSRPKLGFYMRQYSSQQTTLHFLSNLSSFASDTRGQDGSQDWYAKAVPLKYEVEAAHLTAQLPIMAVMGAETQLPRVTKEQGASEQPFTQTRLQVKWRYVWISLTCIQVILLSLVVAVCWICKKEATPLPDHDSYLSFAWLLKTAMVEHGHEVPSEADGERLAEGLGKFGSMKYRLMKTKDGRWEWGIHYEE